MSMQRSVSRGRAGMEHWRWATSWLEAFRMCASGSTPSGCCFDRAGMPMYFDMRPWPGRKSVRRIYLTPEQNELLKALNQQTKAPAAEYIRQGIDRFLDKWKA